MKKTIELLLGGKNLSESQSYKIMKNIMTGKYNSEQIAGLLVALRAKGETSEEITGFARAMRSVMTRVSIKSESIDMCGTGGDNSGTFNISTAASILAAACGVKVAKHGNRSMTSKSGSADVLEALGINIAMPPEKISKCIETIGIGFMFAPSLHPAMKYAINARNSLAIRTVFNLLGPLCNPAGVERQVIGVFGDNWRIPMAQTLKSLGTKSAMVIHGEGGLDEITNTGKTKIARLDGTGKIFEEIISPEDFGMKKAEPEDLLGGTPEENAEIFRNIFSLEKGFKRDVVVLNAAAGCIVSGLVKNFKEGITMAENALDSGLAKKKLEQLIRFV